MTEGSVNSVPTAVTNNVPQQAAQSQVSSSQNFPKQLREEQSSRERLAEAFEGLAQNEVEKRNLADYKANIQRLNELDEHLTETNRKIRELSFAKGKRDMAEIARLREEAGKTANAIDVMDRKLLRLEASKPMENLLKRSTKNAYDMASQKAKGEIAELRQEKRDQHREDLRMAMERIAELKQAHNQKKQPGGHEVPGSLPFHDCF